MAIMKIAALSTLVALALASHAFAILRPRFPHRPVPPSASQIILVSYDLVEGASSDTPVAATK